MHNFKEKDADMFKCNKQKLQSYKDIILLNDMVCKLRLRIRHTNAKPMVDSTEDKLRHG